MMEEKKSPPDQGKTTAPGLGERAGRPFGSTKEALPPPRLFTSLMYYFHLIVPLFVYMSGEWLSEGLNILFQGSGKTSITLDPDPSDMQTTRRSQKD